MYYIQPQSMEYYMYEPIEIKWKFRGSTSDLNYSLFNEYIQRGNT